MAEDRSLSSAQYVDLGMPAPDREWSPEDYGRAVEVLRKIASEDLLRLPRLESPQSGSVMARMVSSHNLELLKNDSLPFDRRVYAGNAFVTSTKALLMLYAEPENKGLHFDREIVALLNFEASVLRLSTGLMLRFLATLSPEEASTPVRRSGWDKMWSGMAMVVGSRLTMIGERFHYRAAERIHLVRGLDELLAEYFTYLPEMTRREIPVRLRELLNEESDEGVRTELQSVLKTLSGNLPSPIAGPGKPSTEAPSAPEKPATAPRLIKTHAGKEVEGGWFAGEASDGSFVVEFPWPYNEKVAEAAEKDGVVFRALSLGTRTPLGATFGVMSMSRSDGKFPKGSPVDSYGEEFKKKGELRKEKDIMLGGWPGKEIEVWNRQSEMRGRVFAKDGKAVTLVVEVPFGQTAVLKADGDRFFDSFKLKE